MEVKTLKEYRISSPTSPPPPPSPKGHEGPAARSLGEGAHALLTVRDLVKHYRLPRDSLFSAAPIVQALRCVSFNLRPGQALGIVGESGSGKSTLARLVMALEAPTSGSVHMNGRDLNALSADDLRAARVDFQMVFQDPYGSLDPRQRVGCIVAEPLPALSAAEQQTRIDEALNAVGLRASDADKYPHEFSGGQRQRIAIARALITRPKLIVADEPVSALDVSVQAQVLNLLQDLRAQFGVAFLFISHDLAVVDHVCGNDGDEVAVMFAGRIVEQAPSEVLFHRAAHPYTRALIAAVPGDASVKADGIKIDAPSSRVAINVAVDVANTTRSGCSFASRCPLRQTRCDTEAPELRELASKHLAACHFA
jgi:peptide/nickel transport system ATP-binding protein